MTSIKQKRVLFQIVCLVVFGISGLTEFFGNEIFSKEVFSQFEMVFILGQYFSLASIFISIYQLFTKSDVGLQWVLLMANLFLYGSYYWAVLFMLSYYPIIFISIIALIVLLVFGLKRKADKQRDARKMERVSGKLVWLITPLLILLLLTGLAVSRKRTEKDVLKKYPVQTSEQSGLSAAIITYQAVFSKWPRDKEELKKYITDNKGDFNFEPYKNLSFAEKEGRTLEVSFDWDNSGKTIKETFELKPIK